MRIRVWTLCGALIHTCASSFLLLIFTVRLFFKKKQNNKRMAEYYSVPVSLPHTERRRFWLAQFLMDALLAQRHTTDKKVKMFENCGRNFIGKVGKLLNVCWSSSSFFPTFCFVTVFSSYFLFLYDRFLFVLLFRIRGEDTTQKVVVQVEPFTCYDLLPTPWLRYFLSLLSCVCRLVMGGGYKAAQTVHRKWWKLFGIHSFRGHRQRSRFFLSSSNRLSVSLSLVLGLGLCDFFLL